MISESPLAGCRLLTRLSGKLCCDRACNSIYISKYNLNEKRHASEVRSSWKCLLCLWSLSHESHLSDIPDNRKCCASIPTCRRRCRQLPVLRSRKAKITCGLPGCLLHSSHIPHRLNTSTPFSQAVPDEQGGKATSACTRRQHTVHKQEYLGLSLQ